MAPRNIGTLATIAGVEVPPMRQPVPAELAPGTKESLDTADARIRLRNNRKLREHKILRLVFSRLAQPLKEFVLAFNRHPARWPSPMDALRAVYPGKQDEKILRAITKATDARSLLIVMANLYSPAAVVEVFEELGIDLDETVLETYIHISAKRRDDELTSMRTRARAEEMARTAEVIMRTAEDDKVRIRAIETLAKIEGIIGTGSPNQQAKQSGSPQVMIINLLEGIDEAETRSRLDRIKATTKALIGAPTPNTPQDDQDGLPDDDYIDVEATPLEDMIDDPEPSSSQDEPLYDEEDLDEF